MKLYYQFPGTWFGDCMPFGKGDEFFLFHQRGNRNRMGYPKKPVVLVVDDTIGTLHVDGVALNVRMYERPGESLGVFATDGTVEVRNASIARGLKRK